LNVAFDMYVIMYKMNVFTGEITAIQFMFTQVLTCLIFLRIKKRGSGRSGVF
jgi:hypothetical protein